MRSSAVPLAFLAFSVLTAAVREMKLSDGELEAARGPMPLNMDGDETEATQLINKLEVAILTRNQNMQLASYLEKMFTARAVTDCDATQAPRLSLYRDGWVCAVRPLGLDEGEANLLMNMLGTPDLGKKTIFITTDSVKDAILGIGAKEEREQVLAFVWKKFTGHDIDSGSLEPDDLVCKKPELRETFINYIKAQGGGEASQPLDYEAFRTYYMGLGAGITSHRHFVLMVVNAWHIMDSPYDTVNTVNLRVRAVKSGESLAGGKIYALNDDCGVKAGEESMTKMQRIKSRLEAQTGATFTHIFLSGDRA